jgi:hypothetical protein
MLSEPAELLAAWEAAARVPPVARGGVLVHRAALADDVEAALDLPIGRSAALAARAHADAFGTTIDGVVGCACGEELDVTVPLPEIASDEGGEVVVLADGLTVRAPTTRDLLETGREADPASALLARCVHDADGAPVKPSALSDQAHAEVDAAAESLAGAGGLVLRTSCPACGSDVGVPVDVGALLWERVATAARELLGEVAELAVAFGWTEPDVLALTPLRRRAYLELARSGP